MSHYDTLGVARVATPEQLKTAYRELVKTHHPDHGGDAARFQAVKVAHDELSDPVRRRAYDAAYARRRAEAKRVAAQPLFAGPFQPIDAKTIFLVGAVAASAWAAHSWATQSRRR